MSGNQTNASYSGPIIDWHVAEAAAMFGVVFLSLLSLGTVIVNGFALFVVYRDPLKVFRTPLAVFLTSLVASDFMTGLIVEPVYAFLFSQVLYPSLEEEEHWRHLRGAQVLIAVTVNTSYLAVVALAVVQLLATKSPGLYLRLVTTRNALIGVAVIWVYGIFFSLIPEIFNISIFAFYAVDLILHPLGLSIILIVVYTLTYFAFRESARNYESTQDAHPASVDQAKQSGKTEAEKEFLRGTLALILLLIFTVGPYSVALGLFCFHDMNDLYTVKYFAALLAGQYLLLVKFFVDPFLFVWRLPKYRKASILVFREIREVLGLLPKSMPNASYHHADRDSSESDLGHEPDVNLGSPSLTLQIS